LAEPKRRFLKNPAVIYDLRRKFEVGQNYLQLWELNFPTQPTVHKVARDSNIGWEYAAKVLSEVHLHDKIINQTEISQGKNIKQGAGNNLIPEEDFFLLSLRVKIPNRPSCHLSLLVTLLELEQ
jgi:hypothetical protein